MKIEFGLFSTYLNKFSFHVKIKLLWWWNESHLNCSSLFALSHILNDVMQNSFFIFLIWLTVKVKSFPEHFIKLKDIKNKEHSCWKNYISHEFFVIILYKNCSILICQTCLQILYLSFLVILQIIEFVFLCFMLYIVARCYCKGI